MIKNFLKKFFKKKVAEEVTLIDKVSELIQIAMDYEHTDSISNCITIEYQSWSNNLLIWMWYEGQNIIMDSVKLDSENVIELLEKKKIKILKLIEIVKVKKED